MVFINSLFYKLVNNSLIFGGRAFQPMTETLARLLHIYRVHFFPSSGDGCP